MQKRLIVGILTDVLEVSFFNRADNGVNDKSFDYSYFTSPLEDELLDEELEL